MNDLDKIYEELSILGNKMGQLLEMKKLLEIKTEAEEDLPPLRANVYKEEPKYFGLLIERVNKSEEPVCRWFYDGDNTPICKSSTPRLYIRIFVDENDKNVYTYFKNNKTPQNIVEYFENIKNFAEFQNYKLAYVPDPIASSMQTITTPFTYRDLNGEWMRSRCRFKCVKIYAA